jgi:diacylglycerol kinase (ATP)
MSKNASLSLKSRVRSIALALRGIGAMLATQRNAWIHAVATVAVCAAGLYFGLTAAQWALIAMAMTLVWVAEAFNTALEFLADAVSPEFHPLIGKAKDIAAGAVLLAAAGSVAIGALVFVPHIRDALK